MIFSPPSGTRLARAAGSPESTETASGRVVAIRGDVATVAVPARFACPRCASGGGCGAGLVAGDGERRIDLRLPAGSPLRVGAGVRLVIAPRRLLAAASLAYGLPLAAFVLATGLGWLATGSDPAAAVAGVAGLAAALWAGRRRLGSNPACAAFVPVLEPGDG